SLPLPDQVSLDPGQLLFSAAVAVGAILLIAFPYELFNSTVEENYDEIRSWFGLGPRGADEAKVRSRTVTFFVMCAVTAVTFGFLSPDFGLNMTSLVLSLGAFVALVVMAVVFSLPADIGIHRQFGEWGKLNFLPGSVVIAIVMVVLSRLLEFQPGYMYGALAGLAFRSALSEKEQGKLTAANWLLSLVVSVGAFFLRAPVTAAAAEPGSSIWWIGLEICLAIIFLWGVEGLAVAKLPMRFLDGQKVMRWNRAAWAVLFFLGVFATVHVLLRPGSGYVGETSDTVTIGVMVLYVLFGLGSAAFWAYFRYRPARWATARS
ncbi:MAG TPA: FGLLP motif-containing membrane protein, partial [Acidimicrobiales bacterium]|nr:FGLLP motif-containing membrane protein [Acidimicrobiales bacterium]